MAGNLMDEFDRIYGSGPNAAEQAGPSIQSSMEEVVEEYSEESIDDELAAAERQIAKATYYKAIVRQGVVEDDGTELSAEVNAEAKLWARYMTMRLLRPASLTEATPAASQFTDPEVHALKRLAAIALAKSGEVMPTPMVKMVPAPAPGPVVKKVASREPARPAAQPARKPQQRRPGATAAAKKPAGAPKGPQPATGDIIEAPMKDGELDAENIPSNQVFLDPRDGKKYKFVDNRMYDPDIPGSKARSKLCIENQAVRGTNPIPMPTPKQMEMISLQQATETIEAGQTAGAIAVDNGQQGQALFGLAASAALRK